MPGETEETRRRFNAPVSRPSPSGAVTAPPGERGGQGTVGANEVPWISTPQSSEEYYAPGGQGTTNQNISNPAYPNYVGPDVTGDGGAGTDTGSGSSGGSGASGIGKYPQLTLDQIRLFNQITGGNVDILETKGGYENLFEKSKAGLTINDKKTMQDLKNLQAKQINTAPTIDFTPKLTNDGYTPVDPTPENIEDPVEDPYSFGDPRRGPNWSADQGNQMNYNFNENNKLMLQPNLLNRSIYLGWQSKLAQGGPVGLMSLPQGYANGGEVIEGEDTMEELTPFGGTRERVMDQVEAFDNAPHHIEEPMVGMYGEKVPLTTARRVQEYMEGLDPVKRNLIQEMMEMFRMKKMMEEQQDQQQKGNYFGPRPEEYAI